MLSLATASALLFGVQAIAEERVCRSRWPADYDAYVRRVPRFNVLAGVIRFLWERLTRAGS
jgi:protein-S-isoprenylcysteine O-methyltransferase Ste14